MDRDRQVGRRLGSYCQFDSGLSGQQSPETSTIRRGRGRNSVKDAG